MALLFADNFSHYGTTARMLEGVYAQVNGNIVADPDGVSPNSVFRAFTLGPRKPLPSTNNVTGMAARMWLGDLPGAGTTWFPGMVFANGSGNYFSGLIVTSTGALSIPRFNDHTTFSGIDATTTGPVVSASGWYHLELIYYTDTKTIEVFVEGRKVLEAVSASTTSGSVSQVLIGGIFGGGGGGAHLAYFKDFVIWNGSGSRNNVQIGTVQVQSLDLDGDVSQPWVPTPTGATGADILSNNPPNNAEYLTAVYPPPAPYIGTLTDLPADVTSVKGIVTYTRFTKTDGGDASVQVSLLSDGEVAAGTDHAGSVAQTYWLDVFETDPSTALPWTPAAVDDLEIQLDRTT